MPVIKANTLTEGNNNHWNLILPAWRNAATEAERIALNTWRLRVALEDEKGNRQNSGVVEIIIQQNRHIELIADKSTDTDRTDHSHEASVPADGKQGITLGLLLTDAFGDTTDRVRSHWPVRFQGNFTGKRKPMPTATATLSIFRSPAIRWGRLTH